MAVTFDAVASGGGFPPSVNNINHSLGVGSGNDRIVLVGIVVIGNAPHTFSTITYNSVTMNAYTQLTAPIFGRITSMNVFYLLDADLPGASGSYTLSYQTAGGPYDSRCVVLSYTGVDQSVDPPDTASSANGSNPAFSGAFTTNITPNASSGLLVDFGGGETTGAHTMSPGASQTERADLGDSDILISASEKAFSSTAANSMSMTPSGTYYTYGHRIIELAEVGGGGDNAIFYGMNF